MNPDEELELLDQEIEDFSREHPNKRGLLEITNTAFRAAGRDRWHNHQWGNVSNELAGVIISGSEAARRDVFLRILSDTIDDVNFVEGVDIIRIVPHISS
jgi:hypothetical protein